MSKGVSRKYARKIKSVGKSRKSKSLFGGLFKTSRRRKKLFGIF